MKLYIALAAFASFAVAQTFRVSGTVVDSETGAPLSRARVMLMAGPVHDQSLITKSDGRFTFDVPQGKYSLSAGYRDFGYAYGEAPSGNSDATLIVGPKLDTTNLSLRWRAPVAVHGRVLDENGEPVYDASVEFFKQVTTSGQRRIISLGVAKSDELGNYSYSSLGFGTYYLAAKGAPWYFSDGFPNSTLAEQGNAPAPYALTYYPDTLDPRAASPLVLRPGADAQADFVLRRAAGAAIHFACVHAPCNGLVTLFATGVGGVETVADTLNLEPRDVSEGVPPGRYAVWYAGAQGNMRKVIEVAGGDITVEIEPKPPAIITGRMTVPTAREEPRFLVFVTMVNEDSGAAVTSPIGADGTFSARLDFPRVRLFLSGQDGFVIARLLVKGATVSNGVLDVPDGARVEVRMTASRANGALTGYVKNGEKPVPAVMVVLAPAMQSSDPAKFLAYETDSDGSFEFDATPPGDYILFAAEDLGLAYTDPSATGSLLPLGKKIHISADEIQSVEIAVADTSGR